MVLHPPNTKDIFIYKYQKSKLKTHNNVHKQTHIKIQKTYNKKPYVF
jgi:hypothetical protein